MSCSIAGAEGAYVGSEDVIRDRRLVDRGVLVRFQVDERIVRDALGDGSLCRQKASVSVVLEKEAIMSILLLVFAAIVAS